jgi:outer membrane protein assembly factor BamE (lipoprotein component of BamABCDE complex)
MAAARCISCGRAVEDASDARKEGKVWFCSQSCYLQHQSRLPRLSDAPARRTASPPPIGGRVVASPLRVIWKTIKVAVATVVLIVVAVVILFFVALDKGARDLNKSLANLERPASISSDQFRHVKAGTTRKQVRAMLGKPSDKDSKQDAIGGERCWYYGSIFSTGKAYAVCFTHNEVSDKFRVK